MHKGVISGGNLFGTEVAESWTWAESKAPLGIMLQPIHTNTASINLTASVSLFDIPEDAGSNQLQLQDWYMSIDGYSDMYLVVRHATGSQSLYVDIPISNVPSGDYSVSFYKTDYKLSYANSTNSNADSIYMVIDSSNYIIPITVSNDVYNVYLTRGTYTRTAFETHVSSAVTSYTASSGLSFTVTEAPFMGGRKFTISADGVFSINFVGQTEFTDPSLLGLEYEDYTSVDNAISSVYPITPSILRISGPINTHRETPVYGQAAKDASKIFMLDKNTFEREFPLSRLARGIPTKFCITQQSPFGDMTLRFNSLVDEKVRVELNYIKMPRNLKDETSDFPLVPPPYTKFLVYGAAYFLLMDKSDSKAQQYFSMAQVQLKAMVNDNRKGLSLSGQNYGRLIPRANIGRYYGFKV